MGTLKPHINSNTVIGTLAVDGWTVSFGSLGLQRRGAWAG